MCVYICTGEISCLSAIGDIYWQWEVFSEGCYSNSTFQFSLLLFWAFPLFSLFLLHAARGLCSRPRELTVVIMVLTMKGLKLLLGFFSFNESEKSGGDKSKSRRWRQRERFHVHKRIKNRHWKSCLQKKHVPFITWRRFLKTTKQFTKLCRFT